MAKKQDKKEEEKTSEKKDKYIDSETVVFYGSWFKALEEETVSTRCKFYELVIRYGCFKIEPSQEEIASHRVLWKIIKDIIDKDKKKRKERIEKSRKRVEKYRENQRNRKNDVTRTHVTNDFPINIYEHEHENEGEIDTENENDSEHVGVSVNEPVIHVNSTKVDLLVTKNNKKTSSSSFKNIKYDNKDDGGDDGVASSFVNKEKIFEYCRAKGIDKDWLEDVYVQLEAQNFTIGKKPITNLAKFLESKWEKTKALKNAQMEKEQKSREEEESRRRITERKKSLAEYRPPKEHLDKWAEMWTVMKAEGKAEIADFWRCSLMFRSLDNNKDLNIVLPNEFYYSEFKKRYKEEVFPYIQKVFGEVKIHYLMDSEMFSILNEKCNLV